MVESTNLLWFVFCRFFHLTISTFHPFIALTAFFFCSSECFQKRGKLGAIYFIDSIALHFDVTMVKTRARCYQSIKNYFDSTVNQRVMDKKARANCLHWLESSSFLTAVNYLEKKMSNLISARNLKFSFQSRSRKIRAAWKTRKNWFEMWIFCFRGVGRCRRVPIFVVRHFLSIK